MSDATTTPKTELTVTEVIGSLTGYDEDAIAKAFEAPLEELDEVRTVRSLVFVVERRRDDVDDKKALKAAMSLTRDDVMGYFTSFDEAFPEEPSTPAGND